MSSSFVPFEFSRAEAIGGLIWLSVGAALSLVLEVVYLGAYITMPSGMRIAFPLTILIGWWFNKVLTKTAPVESEPTYRCHPVGRVGGRIFCFSCHWLNNWRSMAGK